MTAYRSLARYGLAVAALLVAAGASAKESVVTLSPAAKEKLLDAAAARRQAMPDDLAVNGIGRKVHGEVGMFVGTGGARGIYGSAVAPLGESGSVGVAFENSRYGRRW